MDILSTLDLDEDKPSEDFAATEDGDASTKKVKKSKKGAVVNVEAANVEEANSEAAAPAEKAIKYKTDVKKMTKDEKKRFKLGFDIIDNDADDDEMEKVTPTKPKAQIMETPPQPPPPSQ